MSTAYRRGLLRGLSENGISPSDVDRWLEKRSGLFQLEPLEGMGGALSGIGKAIAKVGIDWPVASTIVAGTGLGMGAGYLAHKAMDDPYDKQIQDYKDQMMANELQFHITRLKKQQEQDGQPTI